MGSRTLTRRLLTAGLVGVALATSSFAALGATGGWPTYQHDAGRTGADPDTAAVTGISAGWNTQLDAKLYAQPLVAGSLVYAATENNTVYALDVTSGAVVWQNHLSAPARSTQLPCGNIDPYGITGTPVIDTAHGVLYTAALQASPTVHHELYALNLNAAGTTLYHYPIDAPGSDPLVHGQRGALTLANSKVYVPYSGRAGDCGSYVGRVVGVNTGDATGASLVNYVLPNTARGGIWAAGSADGAGNIYVATGNSNASGSVPDRGESVVKLSPTLAELDFFTAPEWSSLNASDTDIGSIGPILLQNGWILQSGKSGMGYLLNSANMGHLGGQLFEGRICDAGQQAIAFGAYLAPSTVFVPCTSSLKAVHITTTGSPSFTVTTVRSGYSGSQGSSPPIIAGGVLWNLDAGNHLLLGFNPSTGAQQFSESLAGTPVHFAAPSAGAGHVFVPSGSILEGFALASGVASTPTGTPTTAPTSTNTPTTAPSTPTATAARTSTPTPGGQPTYTSHAVGSPEPVTRGTTFTIASTVTDQRSETVLVDIEVYDPAFNKVFQQFFDNQVFTAGKAVTYNAAWQVPATAPTGSYTTMIGIFSPGWGTLKSWNSSADTFSVLAASLPTATSTPTPRPTSTPTPTRTPTVAPTRTSTATPTPVAQPSTFTSTGNASSTTIHTGDSLTFTASVNSSAAATALVDVEVYDPAWHKVFQQFWDGQSFTAGQTLSFSSGAWVVPASSTSGTYTVMIGAFAPGWTGVYEFNPNAATFVVN